MIYIQTNFNNKVIFIHNCPFDEKYGMGKDEKELLLAGFLVDSLPTKPQKDGFCTVTYYTKEDGFYFKYEQLPQKQYDADEAVVNQIQDDLTLAFIEAGIL